MKCVKCLNEVENDNIYCLKCKKIMQLGVKNDITMRIIVMESIRFSLIIVALILSFKFLEASSITLSFLFFFSLVGIVATCIRIRSFRKKDIVYKEIKNEKKKDRTQKT